MPNPEIETTTAAAAEPATIITSHNPLITLPIDFKKPAHWAMSCRYTPSMQKQKGKEKQVYRDDVTYAQFKNTGDKVDHLHPIAILLRKLTIDKWQFTQVEFYDNHIHQVHGTRNQQILKIIITNGNFDYFNDQRENYYNVATGLPHNVPINKMPNQNL